MIFSDPEQFIKMLKIQINKKVFNVVLSSVYGKLAVLYLRRFLMISENI